MSWLVATRKVDAIWAPSVATMYPDGFATKIAPGGPALAGLEDKFRPHFFGGVCTVVAKLLLQVTPTPRPLAEGLPATQSRDRDGARPRHSDEDHWAADGPREGRPRDVVAQRISLGERKRRAVAPTLYRVLTECAAGLKAGRSSAVTLGESDPQIGSVGFAVDYLEVRHAETLAPITSIAKGRRGCWWRQDSAAPG